MTRQSAERHFNDAVLKAVSPEVQKYLEAFAQSISHAEGVLREYHATVPSEFSAQISDPMAMIRENARLIFTMTWTKAVLFSRSVVDSVNDGNLLVAFLSLRSYLELVAAVRFQVRKMEPLMEEAVSSGQVSEHNIRRIASHMIDLLHGGRFNWAAYFEEGAKGIIDRKRIRRTREEKEKFEGNSLRIGKCVEDWGKEEPMVEFTYDYLSDLVHPNKGSNLILLVERSGKALFDVGESRIAITIFERIFPSVASLCADAMIRLQPFFAMIGADD